MGAHVIIAVVLVVLCLGIIWISFASGSKSPLASASAVNSVDVLVLTKASILDQWAQEQTMFTSGSITGREWKQRQSYLESRYIDVARRIDYLKTLQERAS